MRFRVLVVLLSIAGLVHSQDPAPMPGVTVSIACTRQAVSASESFPVKITVTNDARSPSVAFDRADLVSPKSMVAATYEKKGQWVKMIDQPPAGALELRPGESFTTTARISLPEALTASPTALLVQWVGRGGLENLRSNELTVSIRDDKNPTAVLDTSEGTIVLELWPDKAPNHVANLVTLARAGFYDGRLFHRVIPNFMVQTGCPLGTGTGDPGYKIPAEFTDTAFTKGVLGMARSPGDNDSAGSQFFICVADYRSLDKNYTAFGRVIEGQDVADKIALVPRDTQNDRPKKDVVLTKVTVTTPVTYQLPEVKKVGAPKSETRTENK